MVSTGRPARDSEAVTFTVAIPPVPPIPMAWTASGVLAIPAGTAYVTVGMDAGGSPIEVFVQAGTAGTMQGTINALCRVISTALQHGVPPARIVKAMIGQADGLPPVIWPGGPPQGGTVRSVADAIARVLSRWLPTDDPDDTAKGR